MSYDYSFHRVTVVEPLFFLGLIWRGVAGAALVDGLFLDAVWLTLGSDNYVGVVVRAANEGMNCGRGVVVWAHALLHPFAQSLVHVRILSLQFIVIVGRCIRRCVLLRRVVAWHFGFCGIFSDCRIRGELWRSWWKRDACVIVVLHCCVSVFAVI